MKVVQLNKFDYRLSNRLDTYLQKLRCRVNYHALKFTDPIIEIANLTRQDELDSIEDEEKARCGQSSTYSAMVSPSVKAQLMTLLSASTTIVVIKQTNNLKNCISLEKAYKRNPDQVFLQVELVTM
ncbi:O-fucosyltransferase 6 [Camellia lanceoleosa]|uniref:O-fucosyltransferase 6 n=1 Tax=Camellia lanceoleosa TaxID=1840588 RepID=A0ACC0H0Q6_9ERIC|nr:O-fucosyltransferase 6 [Camellia lanceoleosa]